MSTFALGKINELDAVPHIRIPIYKLMVNGDCEYDDWRADIETQGTYAAELKSLDTSILMHAQMQRIAKGKCEELSGAGDIKEFEFRSRNLRIYLFRLPGTPGQEGKVIVFGGLNDKKLQKQQIARMRRIKKEYYDSLRQ